MFPTQVVYIDMRLLHQEGEDTNMKTISDENLATSEHSNGALEHVLIVKLALICHLEKQTSSIITPESI